MEKINKKRLQLFAIAFFLFILLGCSFFNRYLENQSDLLSEVTTEVSIFSEIEGIECIPDISNFEEATLVSVIDGDSIKVAIEGEPYQVRYIGIDTPEYYSEHREAAIAASNENERLLAGSPIYLFKDQSNTDKYDRLLRYVVANDQFINLELVRSGHAQSKWYKPDISCQRLFDSAESN